MLTKKQEWYLAERPSLEERRASGIDGSEMELQIVSTLVRAGLDENAIIAAFDDWLPPCYAEPHRGEKWLLSLIARARASERSRDSYKREGDTPPHPPRVEEIGHTPKKRTYASNAHRVLILQARIDAETRGDPAPTLTDWRAEIVAASHVLPTKAVSPRTARRISDELAEAGFVRLDPGAGNRKMVSLTEKGRLYAAPTKSGFSRSITTSKPRPSVSEVLTPDAPILTGVVHEPDRVQTPKPTPQPKPRVQRSAESRRMSHIRGCRANNHVNGVYRLSFAGQKTRFIQFLQPADVWRVAAVYPRLPVGYDDDGIARYVTVVVDPDDPAARDLIETELGWPYPPKRRAFAPAVELTSSGEIVQHVDEHGEVRPSVGLVMETPHAFFKPLLDSGLEQQVVRVTGTGRTRPRKGESFREYTFTGAGDRLDLDISFDFEAALGAMDLSVVAARLERLPPKWFRMPEQRQRLVQSLLMPENARELPSGMPL